MTLLLRREAIFPATPGRLFIDGTPECDTLELPWHDNQSGVSCVPPGTYSLVWERSPRLKRHTLRLQGVPDRSGILIHPANHTYELRGCIALGKRLAVDSLIESRAAVERVEGKVRAALERGEVVTLDIRNPDGMT